MSNSERKPYPFSRRSFIKGAAAVAASGALAGCSPQAADTEDAQPPAADSETQHFAGVCRCGCAGHCFLDVHVRDGQVVRTTAGEMCDPRYNRICSKGLSHVGRVYSAKRLQYPMKRTGERGEGKFERISWDEAVETVAGKLSGYAEEFGPASNAFLIGSGNFGSVALKSVDRLKAVMGGTLINFSIDLAASFANGHVMGYGGFGTQNELADFPNAKTFVCWGADPTISTPQTMHFILDAIENGAKYIVIDPLFNANAGKADWFVPVNPSTDGALAFGALNHLLDQGWQDEGFIRERTEAPFFVKEDGTVLRMSDLGVEPQEGDVDPATGKPSVVDPYVVWDEEAGGPVAAPEAKRPSLESRSEIEGVAVTLVYDMVKDAVAEYPVSRASELSGVPEDDIRELARTFAQDGPVTTLVMFGPDHYLNGHYNYWPIYTLAAFTGNLCKSGAAAGMTYSQGSGWVNPAAGDAPVDVNGNQAQGANPNALPLASIGDILETGSYGGAEFPLKSITIFQRNVLATGADRNRVEEWMKKIDFVVVAEMVMSETALYADILLPVCHWFEQEDFVAGGGSTPIVMWQDKAVEPQFESRSDYDICKMLAEKMGYGDFFTYDTAGFIDLMLDSDAFRAVGCTPETLREQKTVREFTVDNFVAFENGFATPTGRFSLYWESPMPWYGAGQEIDFAKERTLYWEPSRYADPASESRSGEYPFFTFSQHMRTRTHTQWWDTGYVKEFDPEPTVRLNPEDAAEYGIADGDAVRLCNEHGSVVMRAVVNSGLPRKMLSSGRSFQSFEFIEGHFASLSSSENNQMIPNSIVNDVAVSIEKA